jgi:hypothetical protein
MRIIVAREENPAIPVRGMDWYAHYEGEEEAGMYGWGPTKDAAISDFIENCKEAHDERLNHGWRTNKP